MQEQLRQDQGEPGDVGDDQEAQEENDEVRGHEFDGVYDVELGDGASEEERHAEGPSKAR